MQGRLGHGGKARGHQGHGQDHQDPGIDWAQAPVTGARQGDHQPEQPTRENQKAEAASGDQGQTRHQGAEHQARHAAQPAGQRSIAATRQQALPAQQPGGGGRGGGHGLPGVAAGSGAGGVAGLSVPPAPASRAWWLGTGASLRR